MKKSKIHVVVLGAGFGGLEISTILTKRLADQIELTLIDKNDFFFFGFSKLDVMFGRKTPQEVKFPYARIVNSRIKFKQEEIKSIDPEKRVVKTSKRTYQADVLVIALGADYDISATPGLSEGGNEFYSFKGAEKLRNIIPTFKKGNALVAVTGFPFKCPPAPSEVALLLHEYLTKQGVRNNCNISLVVPFELPIPPSYGTSKALLKSFQEKNINYIPEIMVGEIDPVHKLAILDDGREIPYDLFLGIPEHCVPKVVQQSGLVKNEWIPVDKRNLKTKYSNVYAIGDVTSVGTPKAGIFAEGAAITAAECIVEEYYGREYLKAYNGAGSCYVEFGQGKVAKVDVDFLSSENHKGVHYDASVEIAKEKSRYTITKEKRWFG